MPLTKAFQKTVKARMDREPAFRAAMLGEIFECLITGDLPTGKSLLRDFVNGTCGFKTLATQVGIGEKSLMQMLGPDGNPTIKNLAAVFRYLQDQEGLTAQVTMFKVS
jgi:DNA-binding phage protein